MTGMDTLLKHVRLDRSRITEISAQLGGLSKNPGNGVLKIDLGLGISVDADTISATVKLEVKGIPKELKDSSKDYAFSVTVKVVSTWKWKEKDSEIDLDNYDVNAARSILSYPGYLMAAEEVRTLGQKLGFNQLKINLDINELNFQDDEEKPAAKKTPRKKNAPKQNP